MEFLTERLDEARHDLAAFTSGEPSLDRWLREQAASSEARRVARTFVWSDPGREGSVIGYYSLTGHRLVRASLPRSLGHGSPDEIPAVLLARLALDQRHHGRRMGGVLLADALQRVVLATQTVAARFVVVDALHAQAASFYAHYGFRAIPGTLRLVQKVSDVAASLESAK